MFQWIVHQCILLHLPAEKNENNHCYQKMEMSKNYSIPRLGEIEQQWQLSGDTSYVNKNGNFGFISLPASSYMNPQRPKILKWKKQREEF